MENSTVDGKPVKKRKPGFQPGFDPNRNLKGSHEGAFGLLRKAVLEVFRSPSLVEGEKTTKLMSLLERMYREAYAGDTRSREFLYVAGFGRPPVEVEAVNGQQVLGAAGDGAGSGTAILYVRSSVEIPAVQSGEARLLGPGEKA